MHSTQHIAYLFVCLHACPYQSTVIWACMTPDSTWPRKWCHPLKTRRVVYPRPHDSFICQVYLPWRLHRFGPKDLLLLHRVYTLHIKFSFWALSYTVRGSQNNSKKSIKEVYFDKCCNTISSGLPDNSAIWSFDIWNTQFQRGFWQTGCILLGEGSG